MDDFIKIEIGSSFLLNAGILGLLKLLKYSEAESGKDFIENEREIYLSKEYINNHDMAQLYINAMIERFGENTKLEHLLSKRYVIENIFSKEELSKDDEKNAGDIFKEFTEMLEKSSFKSGYYILQNEYGINNINENTVAALKNEKNLCRKKELYINLCEVLKRHEIKEILLMKEIMYSKINMFYDGVSFLNRSNTKKNITECYRNDFITPLISYINENKAGKKRCIECSNIVPETRSMSFMIDSTDDTARKKSHYWNMKPDAFICPVCAFLYTLTPIGFYFCGTDGVFINNNSSISAMKRMMNSYEAKNTDEGDKSSSLSKLYRIFTSDGIDALERKIKNIQVVVRLHNNDHYEMNIISPEIIAGLIEGKNDLKSIESIFIKSDDGYLSVYDETMKNILLKRNQYSLIRKLISISMKENTNINYIRKILNLQIIFKGGAKMEELQKKVNSAFAAGVTYRKKYMEDIGEKDKDNNLRSLVYKLNNALSVKNVGQFMDTIIRVYSGKNVPIPAVFKDCFISDEMMQAIGYGYILGLKYQEYTKNEQEK